MPSRLEDYAVIGDNQTAALVGKDGSIDWVCFPRFDSGACFAALLGDESNGRWRIAPAAEVKAVRRRYLPDTLVLETEMDTAGGTIRLLDFMPPRNRAPDIVRIVEGVRGSVPVHMELVIRFDYGSTRSSTPPSLTGATGRHVAPTTAATAPRSSHRSGS